MMNEYDKQAMNFCKKNGVFIKIVYAEMNINKNWDEKVYREKYNFTITTEKGKYSGCFWNSIYNKKNHIKPTKYDILSCLEKYDPGTFDDFCCEFGYDNKSRKHFKIYQNVCKEWEMISKIFTEKQLEELREIQ